MTSGGKNLPIFLRINWPNLNFVPNFLIFVPRGISVTHFASPGVPLDAPGQDCGYCYRINLLTQNRLWVLNSSYHSSYYFANFCAYYCSAVYELQEGGYQRGNCHCLAVVLRCLSRRSNTCLILVNFVWNLVCQFVCASLVVCAIQIFDLTNCLYFINIHDDFDGDNKKAYM